MENKTHESFSISGEILLKKVKELIAEGRRYLEMLSGRERDVMERRLNGETLNEISLTYKISKERIRQIEALALRKLRLVASITKGEHAHESTVGV